MLAHDHREPSSLWITIERPTAHMLPSLPAAESYRSDSVVSVYVAMSDAAPMPSRPCFTARSPTSHKLWSAHDEYVPALNVGS